jgi:excisionase family DNA binding protein
MPPERTVEEQYSAAQVAKLCGVDESTVWRWIGAGKIKPVRKLGRRITRIPASAVNRFLAERTVTE